MNLTPGDKNSKNINSAIRQLAAGGSNNTGVVILTPNATTTTVNHESCNPKSHISLQALTLSALAAQQPTGLTYSPPVLTAFVPKIITFTRVLSAAAGNVSYTGVGFKPSLVNFNAGLPGGVGFISFNGSDDGTTSTTTFALGGASGTLVNFNVNFSIIVGSDAAGSNLQKANIATMDVDGFTLTWVKTASPTGTADITAVCYPPAPSETTGSISGGVAGGIRVTSRSTGTFTLTHPANAAMDQTFTYSITGGA
jgi:hypothetical protein